MSIPQLDVDLTLPPEQRWNVLRPWRNEARELLEFYLRDLGGVDAFRPMLSAYCEAFVEPAYAAEMRGVARLIDAPEEQVVLANLYYDALKLVLSTGAMGCTAFAVDAPEGPIHARNLDWTTANGLLASSTLVINYWNGGPEPLYRVVGWPGFVGALTGVAPGRFAVSLNAVVSEDPPELAPPVTLLLRRTLETARDYSDAVEILRATAVASDSLLLVSGTTREEMVVIERSPTRTAVREADRGTVAVANEYRLLRASSAVGSDGPLAATSTLRYARAKALVREARPSTPDACFAILRAPGIQMDITVQHVAMCAATGALVVKTPH